MKKIASLFLLTFGFFVLSLTSQGQTPVSMKTVGTYAEDFSTISSWTDNFASPTAATHYGTITAGTYPNPTQTTVFTSGTTGGIQRGSSAIILLATGSTDGTDAAAFDLYLDFSNVNAGAISLTYAEVNNSTGNRISTFKLQTNTGAGGSFVDLPGANVKIQNGVASGGTISATLPTSFNNNSGVRIRFYIFNSGGTGSTTGSRPKISIDNVRVTSSPTLAVIRNFRAKRHTTGVLLEWETEYESNNLGFQLYRERNGARTRITPSIIAGSAFASNAILTAGHHYSWFDAEGTSDAQYYLEDIDLNGVRVLSQPILPFVDIEDETNAGPVQKLRAVLLSQAGSPNEAQSRAAQRGQPASWNSLSVNITGLGRAELHETVNSSQIPTPQQLTQRLIAAQRAVKIGVKNNGWYRLARKDLIAAGLDAEVYPNFLQLYADGQEIPIIVSNESTGAFGANDYIEFYGLGLNTPTAETRMYYLIAGARQGKRITIAKPTTRKRPIHILTKSGALNVKNQLLDEEITKRIESAEVESAPQADFRANAQANLRARNPHTPSLMPFKYMIADAPQSFMYTIERRERTIFFGSLLIDGDNFFGPAITNTPTTQTLSVSNLDPNVQANLQIALQGVTALTHQVKVTLNSNDLGIISLDNRDNSVQTLDVPKNALREGDNDIVLTAIGEAMNNQTDVSLIDFVRLTYAHTYHTDHNALTFSSRGGQTIKIDGFDSPRVRVLDVTNLSEVVELAPQVEAQGANYSATLDSTMLDAPNEQTRTLYAFVDGASAQAATIMANQPSSLSRPENEADFIIITHRSLRDAVEPLRRLRASQGLNVIVVDIENIYDEFSYGAHDPQAIMEFFRYTLTNWQTHPRFALFVGDATYDPRNYLGYGDNDLVPTKLILTIYSKTASDDALADFTNDGLAALAIGRLPARTLTEARRMVTKIINYTSNTMPSKILFVADRATDSYNFTQENDSLRQYLPASMTIQTINRDDADDKIIRGRIVDGINGAPLIVNFAGHGAVDFWTSGKILSRTEALALTNGARLPFFSLMTCLNGYFQYPDTFDSLAETLLKAEDGGGIAVWASSGSTVPTDQTVMNNELYRQMFSSNPRTLGEMIWQAKTATQDLDVRRTWILFGDPTLRFK